MNDKIIVFDFDGTIADTYHALVNLANELADEFGYQPIDKNKLIKLKDLSSWEIIKQAGIPLFKIPFLFKRVQTELANISPQEWDHRFRASALRRIKPQMLQRNAYANLK